MKVLNKIQILSMKLIAFGNVTCMMSTILFKFWCVNFQKKQMDLKDDRIKLVNEVLNGIKVSDWA